ncbi:MAG: RNA recognition motif domain-containing protein [Prochloraceae cyanobacterium]
MSVRLYVGNLPKEPIDRQELQTMFAELGDSVSTKVIKDRKTGKCRGFAFVTVPSDELADQFIEKYNGQSFMDSPLKIEKALPRSKGKSKEENESSSSSSDSEATPASTALKKRNSKKRDRSVNRHRGNAPNSPQTDAVQPDPRWADELAKLKEMLAAQTTNS